MDDFDTPIYELLMWRLNYDLEQIVMFRRRRLSIPSYPPSDYEMCSPSTQNQAEILANYMVEYCCDDRPMNYYPLLDRIVAWMDDFYGL